MLCVWGDLGDNTQFVSYLHLVGNDPSMGSCASPLLRLLLPLNDRV
jgi:hypothetical protein